MKHMHHVILTLFLNSVNYYYYYTIIKNKQYYKFILKVVTIYITHTYMCEKTICKSIGKTQI